MDSYEATRVVFTRIQTLDPEYASKIMGLLLIQDHGEKEMIRLAFGPESLVHSVIMKARKELGISSPSTPSTPSSPSPFSRQSSNTSIGGSRVLPSPLSIPSLSASWTTNLEYQKVDDHHLNSAAPPFYGASEPDLIDELQIQDQLSFLNDAEMFSPCVGGPHRRSSSVNDIYLNVDDNANGWKPCLYFAKGYCKNGAGCRFTHTENEADMMELLLSKSAHQQRLLMAAASGGGSSNSPKSINFLLNQQSDSPRMAAALMMGDEMNKFGRARLDRNDFSVGMLNPGSRQIYLTFPADSTFREEDVSNYFSMYGPVQDVRIPYQQKRMFGFVTFVYAETVKLILAKGNPHFVCDARVLVKPYKEKGKVPDKFRKQNQHQMDSPTGYDPFDLQIGERMLYNSQDLLWRKKLEEQADLQHTIELQNRRIMDLQLLDVKRSRHNRALSTGSVIPSPTCFSPTYINPSVFASDSRSSSSPDSEDGLISKMATTLTIKVLEDPLEENLNMELKAENSNGNHEEEIDLAESLEHNLPDKLFASPKASDECRTGFSNDDITPVSSSLSCTNNNNLITSPLFPASSTLDLASLKSCYYQFPRFSSGHDAIGI